jgi:hypothetical protein
MPDAAKPEVLPLRIAAELPIRAGCRNGGRSRTAHGRAGPPSCRSRGRRAGSQIAFPLAGDRIKNASHFSRRVNGRAPGARAQIISRDIQGVRRTIGTRLWRCYGACSRDTGSEHGGRVQRLIKRCTRAAECSHRAADIDIEYRVIDRKVSRESRHDKRGGSELGGARARCRCGRGRHPSESGRIERSAARRPSRSRWPRRSRSSAGAIQTARDRVQNQLALAGGRVNRQ